MRDPRANYRQSLEVLRHVKRIQPNMVTKSSLMLGLGETDDEVLQAMKGIKHSISFDNQFTAVPIPVPYLLLTNVSCQGNSV